MLQNGTRLHLQRDFAHLQIWALTTPHAPLPIGICVPSTKRPSLSTLSEILSATPQSPWAGAPRWLFRPSEGGRHMAAFSLPGAVHLVGVTFHLDGDPGGCLGQPVLLRHPGTHLGRLAIVPGGGGRHVGLGQVWCPVGALEQRLVFADHRQRFLYAQTHRRSGQTASQLCSSQNTLGAL